MSEETSVAWCYYCRTEEEFCDEERCCTTCGTDLVVLADRHSFDLLSGVYACWAGEMAIELEDRARRLLRAATDRAPEVSREVAAELLVVAHGLYRRSGSDLTLEGLSAQVGLVPAEPVEGGTA